MSSSSSLIDHVAWSSCEFSMRDFVDTYRSSLPVLCLTRTGYSGCDDDMHQIGAGEVYWVYDMQRQLRLVARSTNYSHYLSIPDDYPLKVHILKSDSNKRDPAVPIKEVVDVLKKSSESVQIMFEDDQKVSFNIGADLGNNAKLGVLEIEDTYEEKYLLCYTVHAGEIYSKTIGIPVYLDITMSSAEGLSKGDAAGFTKWIKAVEDIARSYKSTPVRTCQEIILFTDRPNAGEYEYIKPSSFACDLKDSSLIIEKASNIYYGKPGAIAEPPLPRPNKISQTANRSQTVKCRKLPPFPRRAQPSLPSIVVAGNLSENNNTQPNLAATNTVTPARANKPPISAPQNAKKSIDTRQPSRSVASSNCVDSPAPGLPAGSPQGPPSSSRSQGPRTYEDLSPTSPGSFDVYQSLVEVPTNIQIETLTIGDVCRCLQLLKLEEYCGIFREKLVDGHLLEVIDENILTKEFGFKTFDAKKFLMFKNGWRPK